MATTTTTTPKQKFPRVDWLGVLFFLWVAIMIGVLIALNASQGDWR